MKDTLKEIKDIRVLVGYATNRGSARGIAEKIDEVISRAGMKAGVDDVTAVNAVEIL